MPIIDGFRRASESPNGWDVLLAVAAEWGTTLRVALLMFIPMTAAVALAIYLGSVGIATLASLVCAEGARRAVKQRRSRSMRTCHPVGEDPD